MAMLSSLPARRQAAIAPAESPVAPAAAPAPARRSRSSPTLPNESGSQKLKRSLPWVAVIIGVALLINWNASHMHGYTGIGGAKTQDHIASKGYAQFASGGSVKTATAQQGTSQCVSTLPKDTPTAQCQMFCSPKHKKFHCAWCKCRECSFCPKGGEAIEEAAKVAPPPASPPPPPAPTSPHAELASSADLEMSPEANASSSSLSSSAAPAIVDANASSAEAARLPEANSYAVSPPAVMNGSSPLHIAAGESIQRQNSSRPNPVETEATALSIGVNASSVASNPLDASNETLMEAEGLPANAEAAAAAPEADDEEVPEEEEREDTAEESDAQQEEAEAIAEEQAPEADSEVVLA